MPADGREMRVQQEGESGLENVSGEECPLYSGFSKFPNLFLEPCGPAAATSPGSLLEMQYLWPRFRPINQNLHFENVILLHIKVSETLT